MRRFRHKLVYTEGKDIFSQNHKKPEIQLFPITKKSKFLLPERKPRKDCNRVRQSTFYFYVFSTFQ